MVAFYIRMFLILTQGLVDLLGRLQGKIRKFFGMRAQHSLITKKIHIVFEGAHGRYELHKKSSRYHNSYLSIMNR